MEIPGLSFHDHEVIRVLLLKVYSTINLKTLWD